MAIKTLIMNYKAFTLIELVVGITISMMLMVSVGIFVNNGMSNILTQQKVLENTEKITDFTSNIHSSLNLIQSGSIFPVETSSGIIFKRDNELGKGGFTYIGTSNIDEQYCESGSEDTVTRHLILKDFIPFEEESENIFSNYENILTGSVLGGYYSDQKNHTVKNSSGIPIIGKGVFGNQFEEGTYGTGIYLNSPTGLTRDIPNNILFISDTLNNRILYYDISQNEIYTLLNSFDGLNEPTGLYYRSTEKALYIANSGNNEILKYSSLSESQGNISMTGINENNIEKIEFSFHNQDGSVQNINDPNEADIIFNSSIKEDDYLEKNGDSLIYHIVDYSISESYLPECNTTGEQIGNSGDPINCTTTGGTGRTSSYQDKNLSDLSITINNIDNLTDTGSYYVNVKLHSSIGIEEELYYPYFTRSDTSILTPSDNTLEVYLNNLDYPTGLWWGSSLEFNEFGNRTFNDKTIDDNISDTILYTPIKDFKINKNDDLLTFFLKYYKKYNCYNLDEKTEKTYLFKKSLK